MPSVRGKHAAVPAQAGPDDGRTRRPVVPAQAGSIEDLDLEALLAPYRGGIDPVHRRPDPED